MASINLKPLSTNFNWDDIDVGNDALDHSQNFFTQKHLKHERLDELEKEIKLLRKLEVSDLDGAVDSANHNCNENKENDAQQCSDEQNERKIKQEPLDTSPPVEKEPLRQLQCTEENTDHKNVTPKPTNRPAPPKITIALSAQKAVEPAAVHNGVISKSLNAPPPPPPTAYQFKDLYQRRKEEALKKQLEEERKMREFHSRPMPDYNTLPKQQQRRKKLHAVTVPVTPAVLKKSRETEEKRKKKLDDAKHQMQLPKLEARPANVLKEQPFVPKKMSTVIVPCPFNLHSEKRLQERKQFDEATHRANEEKRKQEERERRKREEHHVKELRKLTKFKARPNPFK